MERQLLARGSAWDVKSAYLQVNDNGTLSLNVALILKEYQQKISTGDLVVWIGNCPHRISDQARLRLSAGDTVNLKVEIPITISVDPAGFYIREIEIDGPEDRPEDPKPYAE